MECQIIKSYLVFPTSRNASVKKLIFRKDGKCVFDLDISLDYVTGERDFYVDVKRFVGDILDISVCPGMELTIKQKDSMPNCRFSERLRPKYHFTAPEGWMGGPCGFVYQNGIYHLFYQQNPCSTGRGNVHWGHATSKNLVDWDCRSTALFPDTLGTVFSGSAIIDEKNLLGMKTDSERRTMVLFYTAAGGTSKASEGQPFTQCVAVSTDGGQSFVKLPLNPVISHIEAQNCAPQVVYSRSLGIYVMSLYLDGDRYIILTSKNLLDWEKIQEICIEGESECSGFFPLPFRDGEKWVLMGACDRYIVGDFDGRKFTPDFDGSKRLSYSGTNTYAAGRIGNLAGERVVRVAWLKTDFSSFGMEFNGAMTVPQELTLKDTADGCALSVYPSLEVDKLRGRKTKNRQKCTDFSDELNSVSRDILLSIDPMDASFVKVSLFGRSARLDFAEMTFTLGESCAPIVRDSNGRINVRILSDVCGLEIYLSGGLAYIADNTIPDMNLTALLVSSDSVIDLKYESFKMRDSRKIDKRR